MTQPAPIKESHTEGEFKLFSRPWIRWFQSLLQDGAVIVRNPTSPYTVQNDNEIVFINTSSLFVVNLKPKEDGLKVRIINVDASTANVQMTPNGTDLLYGYNAFDTIYPGESRDADCNSAEGYY